VIRRRSSQQKGGKDIRRDNDAPAPFFNLGDDPPSGDDGPLFNLEEMHERRILSWSPEPEEFFEDDPRAETETRREREERARSVYDQPPPSSAPVATAPAVTAPHVESTPVAVTTIAAPEPPARVLAPPPVEQALLHPVAAPVDEPVREVAPSVPAAPVEAETRAIAPAEREPKRRGRPRGRPRRQVHFHVDPDEERLLMAAVERYGSQQKGLIAALESLQEAELLRDEIERLRAETARHRRLLDEAESLFNR
jgi:hypothetical protein